jgi:uracil phosphoribosyltransferase
MHDLMKSAYTDSLKSVVMNSESDQDTLRSAITDLGEEIGKKIIENYFVAEKTFKTPMMVEVAGLYPSIPLCAIVTTRDDFSFLGKGITKKIKNSVAGYMDFEGRRGVQALNTGISHLELPELKGASIHTLIVGKAVLATGCTAIHLTKTAIKRCMPRHVVICSIFYTEEAIAELRRELPNVDIMVVGDPDQLNDDGMLIPGIGNLDLRLCA